MVQSPTKTTSPFLCRLAARQMAALIVFAGAIACSASSPDLPSKEAKPESVEASSTTLEPFTSLYWNRSYGQSASYGPGSGGSPKDVFLREEFVNGSDENHFVYKFTTTFDVYRVDSSARDNFFLLGVDSLGNGIVEKWEVVPFSTPGSVTVAAGTPPTLKTMSLLQTRLYTVPGVCVIRASGVDLEERFMYVIHSPLNGGPNQLLRVPLPPDPAGVTVVADATTMPQLASASSIFPLTHVYIGRIWTIESILPGTGPRTSDRTVLVDSNNDGIVEYTATFTASEYRDFHGGVSNFISDGVSLF